MLFRKFKELSNFRDKPIPHLEADTLDKFLGIVQLFFVVLFPLEPPTVFLCQSDIFSRILTES